MLVTKQMERSFSHLRNFDPTSGKDVTAPFPLSNVDRSDMICSSTHEIETFTLNFPTQRNAD